MDKKAAQQKYDAGVKLFKSRRYKDALTQFRSSYDVVASPATHLMIGKTLKELGQLVDAFDELDRAEAEARQLAATEPRYASVADAAAKERDDLRAHVALVVVKLKGADSVQSLTVAGTAVPPTSIGRAIAVQPGTVAVVATTADQRRVEKQATAAVGESADVELDMGGRGEAGPGQPPIAAAPTPEAPSGPADTSTSHRTSLLPFAAVAGGIGLVGVGVFAVFGIMSKNKYDSLQSDCAPNCAQSDIDQGKQQQTIANVGLIVGAVGVATGVTLFAIDRSMAGSHARAASGSRLVIGPGSASFHGVF